MIDHPLRIYTDTSPLIEGQIKNLSPLLSAHWQGLSKDEILAGKVHPRSRIALMTEPGNADFFALPMIWSYYLWNGRSKMSEAMGLADLASRHDKQVVVWHKGDLVPILPFDNAIIFAPGLNRSVRSAAQLSCPVFIDDPTPVYGRDQQTWRKKAEKPSVGFCGFASMGAVKTAWSFFQGVRIKVESKMVRGDFAPAPLMPPTSLRARALNLLSKDSRINSNFVIRDRYTGVLSESESSHVFFSNIYENDYTLCVRGNGNWSYRFYQTLACGRIPIFLDTDCELPLSSHIDWKKYCIWVDRSELGNIGEIVVDFHRTLSDSDFEDLQRSCRALWEEQFTQEGFMANLDNYFSPVRSQISAQGSRSTRGL